MMDSGEWTPRVGLGSTLFALSDALDLVGVDDVFHGKRVAWLARQVVGVLGEPSLLADAHHAALVHDCGVSSTLQRRRVTETVTVTDGHAEAGARLLAAFGPLAHLSEVIRLHHASWAGMADVPVRTARLANLIHLVDRVDILAARTRPQNAQILHRSCRDRLFDPHADLFDAELVDATRQVLDRQEIVDVLQGREPGAFHFASDDHTHALDLADARGLAFLFAQTVDAKSAFTARHSVGVAGLAMHLADAVGARLRASRVELEIAALLHDLGKLHIPDGVLEKPGPLDAAEVTIMRRHSRESRSILERVGGFENIARYAGMHHEFLDGTGYPDGLLERDIPLEAQVLTVADIFQALAQVRPYRAALPPDEVLRIMRGLVSQGRINGELVAIIQQDVDHAWRVAMQPETDGALQDGEKPI